MRVGSVRRAPAWAVALVVAGCGGAAQRPAAPAPVSPSAQGYGAPSTASDGSAADDEREPAESTASPRFATPPLAGEAAPALGRPEDAAPPLAEAERGLERAESELSAAGSDCALACKALASMRRSTARICELDARAEAGARCRSARARLGAAEERVARGCGRCAG